MPLLRRGRAAGEQRVCHEWRAWWRKPSSWRDDVVWADGSAAVSVSDGPVSTMYVPQQRTFYTNQRVPGVVARARAWLRARPIHLASVEDRLRQIVLLDPSFLSQGWELTIVGERKHASRAGVRVKARWGGLGARPEVFPTADEYEVLIDRERGVLLRFAGIVREQEAGVFSVRTV